MSTVEHVTFRHQTLVCTGNLHCLFLSSTGTAHAGHWILTVTGTASGPQGSQVITSIPATSGGPNGQVTMKVTVTGTWTPDTPGDTSDRPPTAPVYIDEVGYANGLSFNMNQQYPAAASDGLQDPAPVSPIVYPGVPTPVGNSTTCSGSHIVERDGSSGTFTVTDTLSAAGNAGYSVKYNAFMDGRLVKLSRQGAVGEYTDSSGTVHGDTTFSYLDTYYSEIFGETTADAYNWQDISAGLTGWSYTTSPFTGLRYPNVTYSWSPNESSDTVSDGLWEVMMGTMKFGPDCWSGTADAPTTKTISYTITDKADGATGTYNYILTVHDKFDNKRPNPAAPDYTQQDYYYATGPTGYIAVGNVNNQNTIGTDAVTITGTVGFKFALTGTYTTTWLSAMTGQNFEINGSVALQVQIGSQIQNIPQNSKEFPVAEVMYPVHNILVDEWDPNGNVARGEAQTYSETSAMQTILMWSQAQPITDPSLPYPASN